MDYSVVEGCKNIFSTTWAEMWFNYKPNIDIDIIDLKFAIGFE